MQLAVSDFLQVFSKSTSGRCVLLQLAVFIVQTTNKLLSMVSGHCWPNGWLHWEGPTYMQVVQLASDIPRAPDLHLRHMLFTGYLAAICRSYMYLISHKAISKLINLPLSHSGADKFQLRKENGICWPNRPNEACCKINKDNRILSAFPSGT